MKRIEYIVQIDLLDDEAPSDWCEEIREAIQDTGLSVAQIGWISDTPQTEEK